MVWWITALKWVFGLLSLSVLVTIVCYITSIITKGITKRRYRKENDIGRKREYFSRSFNKSEDIRGSGMEPTDNERGLLQNTEIIPSGSNEQNSGDDREESRIYSNDSREEEYERFKRDRLR